jgi:hypothetical protein
MRKISFLLILFCFSKCNYKNEKHIVQGQKITSNINDTTFHAVIISNNDSFKNNDTTSKTFYANGKMKDIVVKKDTGDCTLQYIFFYENGNLKETGCQGNVSNKDINTGMSVGTWYFYDSLKRLDSSIYYNNDVLGKDFIEKKRYYKNGVIKSIERYNNYELYETEVDSISIWKFYNKYGKLTHVINHQKKNKIDS